MPATSGFRRLVRELVETASRERRPARHEADGAIVDELPRARRQRVRRIRIEIANRECRRVRLEGGGRVGESAGPHVRRVDDELLKRRSYDARAIRLSGGRHLDRQPSAASGRRDVPAGFDDGEALAHHEASACAFRPVEGADPRTLDVCERAHVSAVVQFEQQPAVGAARVCRPENQHVRRVPTRPRSFRGASCRSTITRLCGSFGSSSPYARPLRSS